MWKRSSNELFLVGWWALKTFGPGSFSQQLKHYIYIGILWYCYCLAVCNNCWYFFPLFFISFVVIIQSFVSPWMHFFKNCQCSFPTVDYTALHTLNNSQLTEHASRLLLLIFFFLNFCIATSASPSPLLLQKEHFICNAHCLSFFFAVFIKWNHSHSYTQCKAILISNDKNTTIIKQNYKRPMKWKNF